jgi:hypothetical protein
VEDAASLLVLDEGKGTILRFEIDGDSIVPRGTIRHGFPAHDFCIIDGRVFVLGYADGFLIHELSTDGKVVRSFGRPEPTPNAAGEVRERINRTQSRGFLTCLAQTRQVLRVAGNRPALSAYDLTGSVAWRATIPGFHAVVPVTRADGWTVYAGEGNTGWFHRVLSLFVDAHTNSFIVQITQAGVQSARPNPSLIESFTFSWTKSGAVMEDYSSKLPTVVTASGSTFVAAIELPFPVALVLERGSQR